MIQFARLTLASMLCLGSLSFFGTSASAAFIPVFSTGVTNTGALAAVGSTDAHYTITSSPLGVVAPVVGTNLPPTYVGNTTTSQWISPAANVNGTSEPAGLYTYTTTFSLAGLVASTAQITAAVASDDAVTVFLNGINEGTFIGFGSFQTFSLTSGFNTGQNTLTFQVNNSFGPTALQANIISATAVPEPASILMVSLGGIALAGFSLRRRQATV